MTSQIEKIVNKLNTEPKSLIYIKRSSDIIILLVKDFSFPGNMDEIRN
jgi:hypothetical protein